MWGRYRSIIYLKQNSEIFIKNKQNRRYLLIMLSQG